MTSASELFYTRRFRPLRSTEPGFRSSYAEVDRIRDRERERVNQVHNHRLPRRHQRQRFSYHDCELPQQLSQGGAAHDRRHPRDRGVSQVDFGGTGESSLGSNSTSEFSDRNVLRSNSSDRLPGTVLQAQARLLARLRGISVTGSRRNLPSSAISWDQFVVSDDFAAADLGEWEADALVGPEPRSSLLQSTSQAEQTSPYRDQREKKPPGLAWEAINTLQSEVFKDPGDSSVAGRASLECCVCLDRFLDGDLLTRLSCSHRFHPGCLNPWVSTCGDCPYCRSRITIDPEP